MDSPLDWEDATIEWTPGGHVLSVPLGLDERAPVLFNDQLSDALPHLHELDGARPAVKVRRAHVRGVYGPPKSRHGHRQRRPARLRARAGATRAQSGL